jgi:hypothetical protein
MGCIRALSPAQIVMENKIDLDVTVANIGA